MNQVHFAVTDAEPSRMSGTVRYFSAPAEARYADVMAAVFRRCGNPTRLTFLEPHQLPTDDRHEVIPAAEVGC